MITQSRTMAALFGLLSWCGAQAGAGSWDPRFDLPGANGPIMSLVNFQGNLYAVGYFTRIAGVDAPGIARWDGTDWIAIQPGLNVKVAAAVATDEAIYLDGIPQPPLSQPSELVRWDGQTWMKLGSPPGYRGVHTLLANGTDVYCEVVPDSGTGKALAKWDGNSWKIVAETSNASNNGLSALAIAQGSVYESGSLPDPANPSQVLTLGRLAPPNWERVGGGFINGLLVFGIASDGTNLFVEGSFTQTGGNPTDGFAIWTGTEWIALPAASREGASVVALTSNPGEVLAIESTVPRPFSGTDGALVQYQGTNRTVLARGDVVGSQIMVRSREGIFCTGGFLTMGNVPTGNLALWNGSNWERVGQGSLHGLIKYANSLVVVGTDVYAGGNFDFAGEAVARNIARWDGLNWHALGSGLDGPVTQIATRGNDLYVLGEFTSAGGIEATNLAKWDGAAWSKVGDGLSGRLMSLTTSEHYVWVARNVNQTNFVISRWDGSNWTDFAEGNFGYGLILTMLATDASLLMGGRFESIDGIVVNNLTRWEDGQWKPLSGGVSGQGPWEPNGYPFAEVRALLQDGTNLYVGGSFTNAGNVPAKNVALWDGVQWSALGNGLPQYGNCVFGVCVYPVTSLAMVKDQLYAGGGFTTGHSSDGRHEGFLARWNGTEWNNVVDDGWSNDRCSFQQAIYSDSCDLHVWALATRSNDLYVAGNFGMIGNVPSYGFAIWHDEPSPTLQVRRGETGLIFSWPREYQQAALESTTTLVLPNWAPLPGLNWPTSDTETNDVEVTITPANAAAFYRLRWP